MENKERNITPEEAVILWHVSRLDLSEDYEQAPEILKVRGSVIGTLGNFSASIGKAKSKKTFNVSAIVAAALKNGTVLNYTAELPENKRKILYVDTEQSTYHCAKVAKRILRMAGLPTDRNHEDLEFLVLRKYTPEERIAIVREAIYRTENVGLVIIDGIRDMVYDINSSGESTRVISLLSKYSINSLVYWVTYVHNVVYSFYRSMIYCYINSTQRCAGSIVIDIIPTNGADKRKFFPFAPYFPVTNVIKRYFYPYFPAIIGIKGYSFPYFPYLSGIMKIKTALYSLFSRLDWHKTVVFPCLGEIYEGIRSLSWEIPVT